VAYAQQADLLNVGLPQQAIGQLNATQISTALQNASDELDGGFRGRYGDGPSPLLLTWDSSVTLATAQIAAYRLMVLRGMDPDSDSNFRTGFLDAKQYIRDVQHQQLQPMVTVGGSPLPGSTQPICTSFSVIGLGTGRTGPSRGW
jgi:hypothetical protein